jgi:hypothetical protein
MMGWQVLQPFLRHATAGWLACESAMMRERIWVARLMACSLGVAPGRHRRL